jgi:3-oxoacyl-[acyl-carrier protein] reductase
MSVEDEEMNFGLEDRVAWVTGASGGIGSAIARALAAEGARVGVGYHTDEQGAHRVADEVTTRGGIAMVVQHDMAGPSGATEAVERILGAWGRLDVLVTCAWKAGGWPSPDREDIAIASHGEWRDELGLNVEGTVRAVRAALAPMKQGCWGRIVLISSGAAQDGQPGLEAYSAAKASLLAFSRSLALGLGRSGILSNVVMPGFVETERNRQFIPRLAFEQRASMTPTGRLATTEDIAFVTTFLASNANRSVTGEAVRVTGGM